MTTLTEQDKTVLLAEKVLQRTCKKHFDDVILTDENGHIVQYFNPYQDWNHTHMVLDQVVLNADLFDRLITNICYRLGQVNNPTDLVRHWNKATQKTLMDAVVSLIQL